MNLKADPRGSRQHRLMTPNQRVNMDAQTARTGEFGSLGFMRKVPWK